MSVQEETLVFPGVSDISCLVVRPSQSFGTSRGVILLVHGFAIPPTNYKSLAQAIAVHGYVIVLPHIYSSSDPVGKEPIIPFARRVVYNFPSLPFILCGHSRGGQACMMSLIAMLSNMNSGLPRPAALILLDPVEGVPSRCGFGGLQPRLLADTSGWPLGLGDLPVLVIGAALGAQPRWCPAAPPQHNYEAIWAALESFAAKADPSVGAGAAFFCVVAEDFGHLDCLNTQSECEGLVVGLSRLIVRSGAAGRPTFHAFASVVIGEFLDGMCGASSQSYLDAWLRRITSLQDDREVFLAETNSSLRAYAVAIDA